MRIKLIVKEQTQQDVRAQSIRELVKALEPARKFTALHKAKKAAETVGWSISKRENFTNFSTRLPGEGTPWFEFRHYELAGSGNFENCEELYQYVKTEADRYGQPWEPSVYTSGLEKWLEGCCEYEMHPSHVEPFKQAIEAKLVAAIRAVRNLKPNEDVVVDLDEEDE